MSDDAEIRDGADALTSAQAENAISAGALAPDGGHVPVGFGAALRRAREDAGMAASELAARLHLHPRQLDALEREDLAALPEPIYIRGYLRGCGRELRIDVASLLADFDRKVQAAQAAAPPERVRTTRVVVSSSTRRGRGAGTKWFAAAIVALVVLFAVVAVVTHLPGRGHVGSHVRPAAKIPPASVLRPSSAVPAAAATAAATPPAPAPAPSAASTAADSMPAGADRPAAPPTSAPAPASRSAPVPSSSNADAGGPAGAAMASAAANQDSGVLTLRTTANVWIDVSDSSGRTLLSQIVPGGSVQTVTGTAPLHLIVGKASAVAAEFRGHAVDLRAHAGESDVARLTLE